MNSKFEVGDKVSHDGVNGVVKMMDDCNRPVYVEFENGTAANFFPDGSLGSGYSDLIFVRKKSILLEYIKSLIAKLSSIKRRNKTYNRPSQHKGAGADMGLMRGKLRTAAFQLQFLLDDPSSSNYKNQAIKCIADINEILENTKGWGVGDCALTKELLGNRH